MSQQDAAMAVPAVPLVAFDPASIPDVTIRRITRIRLTAVRPREVGRVHRSTYNPQVRVCWEEPFNLVETDSGFHPIGWCRAPDEQMRRLIGKSLRTLFGPDGLVRPAYRFAGMLLWEVLGQALGQPVYVLLGARGPADVLTYDSSIYPSDMNAADPAAGDRYLIDSLRSGLSQGHKHFKLKIGRGGRYPDLVTREAGLARDIHITWHAREYLGPDSAILVDANNEYTLEEAQRYLTEVAGARIGWIEEPFPESMEQTGALKHFILERGLDVAIADGEGGWAERPAESAALLEQLVTARVLDVVQRPLRAYGFNEWLELLPLLARSGARAAPHNWGGYVVQFHAAHLARGTGLCTYLETDIMVNPDVDATGFVRRNGLLSVPDTPGFGWRIDPDLFKWKEPVGVWD
jgi:L-alanine-DL-glutamate epimerase-like enolase superfamily enzyme